ncbi:porin [uncultured Turicimonas sp.]|nr:porin [uncultured Turicimonas sp.]
MRKSLIALAVMGASTVAFAASNVTLYGVIEEGVVVTKAKHKSATVQIKNFDQGPRWGLKGTEELGNGYAVSFILEQGFNADTGAAGDSSKAFNRETMMFVSGGFGKLGFGRTGALSSGAQSQQILTGWALGTGYSMSAWNSLTSGTLRVDNAIAYASPVFNGLSLHAIYSNGIVDDTSKWSDNNHYYGIGAKYQANAIKSSLIFEAIDNKGTGNAKTWGDLGLSADVLDALGLKKTDPAIAAKGDKKRVLTINYGLEYNLGSVTPMFAYQWYNQDGGKKVNQFGLSAKVSVGGGDALVGARYLFGKDESLDKTKVGTQDVRSWNVGAAYVYPLSKRTALKAYAGYADSSKGWKNTEDALYNGYTLLVGMRTSF